MKKYLKMALDWVSYLALVTVLTISLNDLVFMHKVNLPVTVFTAHELVELETGINKWMEMQFMMGMQMCQSKL